MYHAQFPARANRFNVAPSPPLSASSFSSESTSLSTSHRDWHTLGRLLREQPAVDFDALGRLINNIVVDLRRAHGRRENPHPRPDSATVDGLSRRLPTAMMASARAQGFHAADYWNRNLAQFSKLLPYLDRTPAATERLLGALTAFIDLLPDQGLLRVIELSQLFHNCRHLPDGPATQAFIAALARKLPHAGPPDAQAVGSILTGLQNLANSLPVEVVLFHLAAALPAVPALGGLAISNALSGLRNLHDSPGTHAFMQALAARIDGASFRPREISRATDGLQRKHDSEPLRAVLLALARKIPLVAPLQAEDIERIRRNLAPLSQTSAARSVQLALGLNNPHLALPAEDELFAPAPPQPRRCVPAPRGRW